MLSTASFEQVICVESASPFSSTTRAVTILVKDAGAVILSAFLEYTTVSVSTFTSKAISDSYSGGSML